MGGTKHLFIESKAFELTIDHGGGAHIVRLYERGKDTLRSIFMGMKSAKTLLEALEELVSMKHTGDFVCTIKEGETVFIAKRCNTQRVSLSPFRPFIGGEDEDRLSFQRFETAMDGGGLHWN